MSVDLNLSEAALAEPAARLMTRCDELAGISSDPDCLSRFYLTPEHRKANDKVAGWMRAAGLETWEDAAGNLWGRYAAADPAATQALIVGSHLDTVPNAGRYDGMLGVLTALSAVEQLRAAKVRLPFHIDIVGFGDEEGARFGTTLLGSRAVAGTWQDSWWELTDAEGVSLHSAFERFGLNPARIGEAARSPQGLLGYLELHIEQGPVLEQRDEPLGVVTAIAGARRFDIELVGHAGHAGTVPMNMRRDALVGAAEFILAAERVAREEGVVATVGRCEALPGGVNVIPGAVHLSLDIRSADDRLRDHALTIIRDQLKHIEELRELSSTWREIHDAPSVACAEWWQQLQCSVLSDLNLKALRLMSGAGHDAMAMAEITDCAMYFLRCKGGISHHPDESVAQADLIPAIATLVQTLLHVRRTG
ncbi:allantoate amidohydrolase [Marinimicrobium koreense]|uniref:allantoate amidohydrolase n=1 Tax=Marinimicrobium koreense TaxID=306545 RepID=UPI003F70F4EC